MRLLFALIFVLSVASALKKEKKINLHDIERDNLANEKKLKHESPSTTPKYSQPLIDSVPPQYGFTPTSPKLQQQFIYQQQPQQYESVYPQYQPQQQYYTLQPQHYQQQYVTSNSIVAPQSQQAYYTPQYVYVQPYSSASTSVQSVVDPKGAVQYVMYVPTPTYVSAPSVQQPSTAQHYVPQQNYEQYIPSQIPQQTYKFVQVAQPQQKYVEYTTQHQESSKGAPKSLLDSYVPSYLQLQYYKQQQSQANLIKQPYKISAAITGKTDYIKTSAENTINPSESAYTYTYQVPSYQQQYKRVQ